MRWEYRRIVWAQRRPSSEARQEFRTWQLSQNILGSGTREVLCGGFISFPGTNSRSSDISDLDQTIAELGLEGWELATHSQVLQPYNHELLWFKRPIADY